MTKPKHHAMFQIREALNKGKDPLADVNMAQPCSWWSSRMTVPLTLQAAVQTKVSLGWFANPS